MRLVIGQWLAAILHSISPIRWIFHSYYHKGHVHMYVVTDRGPQKQWLGTHDLESSKLYIWGDTKCSTSWNTEKLRTGMEGSRRRFERNRNDVQRWRFPQVLFLVSKDKYFKFEHWITPTKSKNAAIYLSLAREFKSMELYPRTYIWQFRSC